MDEFVSILIPCRNEEKYLARCLDSVLAQDYPADRFELLLADGMSEDRTREVMQEYSQRYKNVRWFENLGKSQAKALNIMLQQARGEVIIRLDAHSSFPKDYISNCVKYLSEFKADNVGGLWETCAGADTPLAKCIAWALTSPFGVGGARFRLGVNEPVIAETVPFGCYRKDVFDWIGLFNENMVRNEDNEFNSRLTRAGGKILLHPAIKCRYFARASYVSMVRQKFQDGFWCVYGIKFVGNRAFFPRHLVPMALVVSLLISFIAGLWLSLFLWLGVVIAVVYFSAAIFASFVSASKHGMGYWPYFMIIFPSFHFAYGAGSLSGAIKMLAESASARVWTR